METPLMRMAPAALAAVLLAACNGPDQNFEALSPEIALSHETLDFEQQPVFQPKSLDLFISNGGRAPDNVVLELSGDDVFRIDGEL
jgi:hypothetical protein